MNLIAKLFNKTPSVADISKQLEEIEKDQKRKRRDLAMLDLKKQEKVKLAVEAKKASREALLRDLFRDTSQIEIEIGNTNNDLRRLSLAKAALNSFMRKMELLEKKKDRKGLQNLITRINQSSIQKAIDAAEVSDDGFHDILTDIVGEEEASAARDIEKVDAGFVEFEKAIGDMAQSGKGSADEQASAGFAPVVGAELLDASTIRAHGLQLVRAEEQIAQLQRQIIELQLQVQYIRQQEQELRPKIPPRQPTITTQNASQTAAQAGALHAQAAALMSNPYTAAAGAAMEAQATALDALAQAQEAQESAERARQAQEEARKASEQAAEAAERQRAARDRESQNHESPSDEPI